MTSDRGPVVVAGLPRSGSTWIANVLARADDRRLLHEPDNEKVLLAAAQAKVGIGRFPALARSQSVEPFNRLWALALAGVATDSDFTRRRVAAGAWARVPTREREEVAQGGRPARVRLATALAGGLPGRTPTGSHRESRPALVKTVHAPMALEWLGAHFSDARVLVVVRHPANVLSSWRALRMPDSDRRLDESAAVQARYLIPWRIEPPSVDPIDREAWQVCLLTAVLLDAAARHPDWVLAVHEELCDDSARRFAALAESLGMAWSDQAESFLRTSDEAGDGFAVQRRTSEQPQRWRTRLEPEALRMLSTQASQFPGLERWATELADAASISHQG